MITSRNNLYFILLLTLLVVGSLKAIAKNPEYEVYPSTTSNKTFFLTEKKSFIARNYILGPNDVIKIKFFSTPEFDIESLRVPPDGEVALAHIGSLEIAGLTLVQLQEILEKKYKFYIKNPQISVTLIESKPFIVYVSGAVIKPGSYELDTNTSDSQFVNSTISDIRILRKTPLLSNVIIAAGGLAYDADLENVVVSNNIDNSRFEINLLELIENGDSNQDIYLMPGDSVFIPKVITPLVIDDSKYKKYISSSISQKSIPVKIIGYVNKPGLINLDSSQSFNINSAIASAGGYMNDSPYPPSKIYLSRIDNNGRLIVKTINPMSKDVVLMPNDIIYVPEKLRPTLGRAFDFLGRILNPVNNFANSYNNWALMFDPTRYQVVGK